MADVLDEIEQQTRQLYDAYIRERSDEELTSDVERDLVSVHALALALIRQRTAQRQRLVQIAAELDAHAQLLQLLDPTRERMGVPA